MKSHFILLSFLLLFSVSLFSQSVTIDPSFGKKGKFYLHNGRYNEVKDIAITEDGSVIVLVESILYEPGRDMDVILFKLTPKGELDPSFGKKGIAQFDYYGMNISRAGEMNLLKDGKILIAGDGSSNERPEFNISCLARVLPNGSPDTTFGTKGTSIIVFDKISYITSLHLTDSSICIAGSYNQPVRSHTDIFPVIGKLNSEGVPDSSFGKTGKIWIDFNFEVFTFAKTTHTAGGEIMDILVQDDGKILVCGGYIFAYSYEGVIARFLPNGTLDPTFNSKGYFRHDFTPGKFNMVKTITFYDSNTLIFGAVSKTDFDSDFYIGKMNLTNFSFSVTPIDFKGQHDILEDLSVNGQEIIISGRSILPENAAARQQSNFAAIARIPDCKNMSEYETVIFPFSDSFQNGSRVHAVLMDKIVIGGFQHTKSVYMNDVVISRFVKKKYPKKKK